VKSNKHVHFDANLGANADIHQSNDARWDSSVHNHEVKKKKAIARSQNRLTKRETGTSLMDMDDTSSDDDDDENPLLAANRAAGVRHPGMDALNRALNEVEEEHVKSKNLKALVNKKKRMNGAFGKGHRKHKHREGKESKRFNLDEQIASKNGDELHSPLGLKKQKTMTDQRKERGDKRKARQAQLTKQKTLLESKKQSKKKDDAPVAGIFDVSSDESGDDVKDLLDDTAPKDSGGLFDDAADAADADVMGGLFDDDTAPPASGQDDVETEKKAPVIPAAKTEVVLPAKPATPPATTGLFDVSSGEDGDDY